MSCFRPWLAWRNRQGEVVFSERGDIVETLTMPCGRCVGCLESKAFDWGMRIEHERKLHAEAVFITPTYSPENLPADRSVSVVESQKALDRIRKHVKAVRGVSLRYCWRGEYGPKTGRPHYHAALFGWRPDDLREWKKSPGGHQLYRSAKLEALWGFGDVHVGELTAGSARYIGGYVGKKLVGKHGDQSGLIDPSTGEFFERSPEFMLMSRKPPIGWSWIEKHRSDFWPSGKAVVNGREVNIPRAYLKRFAEQDPDGAAVLKLKRLGESRKRFADNSDERLRVKEAVKLDQVNRLVRSL